MYGGSRGHRIDAINVNTGLRVRNDESESLKDRREVRDPRVAGGQRDIRRISQLLLKVYRYAKLHGESRETSFFRGPDFNDDRVAPPILGNSWMRLRANRNFTWRTAIHPRSSSLHQNNVTREVARNR